MAETADEHVRISAETKERLRRRKRDEESFNDAITRLLNNDRDLLAGFGAAEDRTGDTLGETVARRKENSQHRIEQLSERRTEDDAA